METEQKQTAVDSLTAKSVEILDWLETSVKQTTEFVVEQTPQFIQELLAYSFWYSLIWFFISLIALTFAGRGLYKIIFKDYYGIKPEDTFKNRWGNDEMKPSVVVSRVAFTVLTVVSFLFGSISIQMDWLKIKVAPRVYLLEYALKAIKK